MLQKSKKNFLMYLKKKIKTRKISIDKSIIQNNQIIFKKNLIKNFNREASKIRAISQFSSIRSSTKRGVFLNRWEMYNLYTKNELINFKQWTK